MRIKVEEDIWPYDMMYDGSYIDYSLEYDRNGYGNGKGCGIEHFEPNFSVNGKNIPNKLILPKVRL